MELEFGFYMALNQWLVVLICLLLFSIIFVITSYRFESLKVIHGVKDKKHKKKMKKNENK